MIVTLSQSFLFEAAHTLHRAVPLAEFEPSMRMHGHTYTANVAVRGELGPGGMICYRSSRHRRAIDLDLFELRRALDGVRLRLDHRLLNEVAGLTWPTLEGLCEFIGREVKATGMPLHSVTVSRATGDACRAEFE